MISPSQIEIEVAVIFYSALAIVTVILGVILNKIADI